MGKEVKFKEEYWDNAFEAVQFEENWVDALKVLKQAERKAFAFRVLPYALVFLIGFGLFYTNNNSKTEALSMKSNTEYFIIDLTDKMNSFIAQPKTMNVQLNSKDLDLNEKISGIETSEVINSKEGLKNITVSNIKSINQNKSLLSEPLLVEETNGNDVKQSISERNNKIEEEMELDVLFETKSSENEILFDNNKFVGNYIEDLKRPLDSEIKYDEIEYNYLPLISSSIFNNTIDVSLEKRYLKYKQKKGKLFLEVGTVLLADYGTFSNDYMPNLEVGLSYKYMLNRKIGLSAGVSYFSIEGMNHELSISDVNLSFGRNETKQTFSSTRLYFLTLPLDFSYKVNDYHVFKLGAGLNYLLTNTSSIQTETIENGVILTEGNSIKNGFTDGYRTFNTSINFGYEMTFNPKNSIGFSYELGLNDITKNDYYSDNNDRNSRLHLIYKMKIK